MGERSPAEDGAHPARPLVDARDDEQRAAEREEEHAPEVEHPARVGPDDDEGEDARDDTDDPGDGDDRPREAREGPAAAGSQPHAECGADEERLRPGVGAVVDARVVARVVEADDRGPHRARDGTGEQDEGHPAAGADPEHQAEDDEGDEDVELLLDGEGPGMTKGGCPALGAEVLVPLDDQAPVHDVAERGQHVAADLAADGVVGPEHGVDEDEGQDEEEPGQQPSGAPAVEAPDVDVAPLHPLLDEQAGDEEGRQDEEEVDAHPHAGELVDPEVVGHEAEHEQPTHPVEGRAVPEP